MSISPSFVPTSSLGKSNFTQHSGNSAPPTAASDFLVAAENREKQTAVENAVQEARRLYARLHELRIAVKDASGEAAQSGARASYKTCLSEWDDACDKMTEAVQAYGDPNCTWLSLSAALEERYGRGSSHASPPSSLGRPRSLAVSVGALGLKLGQLAQTNKERGNGTKSLPTGTRASADVSDAGIVEPAVTAKALGDMLKARDVTDFLVAQADNILLVQQTLSLLASPTPANVAAATELLHLHALYLQHARTADAALQFRTYQGLVGTHHLLFDGANLSSALDLLNDDKTGFGVAPDAYGAELRAAYSARAREIAGRKK